MNKTTFCLLTLLCSTHAFGMEKNTEEYERLITKKLCVRLYPSPVLMTYFAHDQYRTAMSAERPDSTDNITLAQSACHVKKLREVLKEFKKALIDRGFILNLSEFTAEQIHAGQVDETRKRVIKEFEESINSLRDIPYGSEEYQQRLHDILGGSVDGN